MFMDFEWEKPIEGIIKPADGSTLCAFGETDNGFHLFGKFGIKAKDTIYKPTYRIKKVETIVEDGELKDVGRKGFSLGTESNVQGLCESIIALNVGNAGDIAGTIVDRWPELAREVVARYNGDITTDKPEESNFVVSDEDLYGTGWGGED